MHIKAIHLLAAITVIITSFSTHASEMKRLHYEGFTVWVGCDKRDAVKIPIQCQHDVGSYKRLKSFHIIPNISSSCQQLSTKTYNL